MDTERVVVKFLEHAIHEVAEWEDRSLTTSSFRDAGVMMSNQGFVLRVGPGNSGPEFQITVVRGR